MSAKQLHWQCITVTMPITVIWMLIVPTPRDRSTAPVIRDIQEVELLVLVMSILNHGGNLIIDKMTLKIMIKLHFTYVNL